MKTRQATATAQKGLDDDLIKSSARGDVHRVKLLLDSRADPHAQNDHALQWAAGYGHLEVVKLLLDRGADIHARADRVLRWAAGRSHADIVMLLIAWR